MSSSFIPKALHVHFQVFSLQGNSSIYLISPHREMKLQKEHDYYTNKLLEWQKKFDQQLDEVAKKLKDFSSKDRMAEAETYMAELSDIQDKINFFQEEVGYAIQLFTCK